MIEPNLVIRRAFADDYSSAYLLIQEYFEYDRLTFDEEAISKGLRQLLENDRYGILLLAEANGFPSGYVLATFGYDLEFGGRQATVTDLYIRDGHRRNGLGRRLIACLEQELVAAGTFALELQPEASNLQAQAFYSAMGFSRLNRVTMVKRLSLPT